jgi:hypothetical protein
VTILAWAPSIAETASDSAHVSGLSMSSWENIMKQRKKNAQYLGTLLG